METPGGAARGGNEKKKRNITPSQCVVSSTQGSPLRERSLVMTATNLNGLLLELEPRMVCAEC